MTANEIAADAMKNPAPGGAGNTLVSGPKDG